ncbi:MAG: hypothetical protein IT324_23425 [Anaerolineae bacterium]|nr:hypothetical protein [Anaerolineae bacterium]
MATLQTARHIPTLPARPKLKLVSGSADESLALPASTAAPVIVEKILASAPPAKPLTELEQRSLLIQTAGLFEGWQLVAVQHRANNGVLIAYLIRNQQAGDPLQLIRDGHALQIMMDGAGNVKVQHPRHRQGHFWQRWWHNLMALFSA